MIISRTPLRISLCGGGTDVPAFYRKHGGAVVSFAINKYVYVQVNEKFDGRTRVSYSKTETVDDPAQLEHDLVRECLSMFQLKGVEVTTVADIPGEGSGLGSSSSLTVGLLNAFAKHATGKVFPQKMCAESAVTVETKLARHVGVGKQDQYAAAYGGLHYYEFSKDEHVSVEPIFLSDDNRKYLESHLLLLWTGITRKSGEILEDQSRNLTSNRDAIDAALGLDMLAHDLAVELQEDNFRCMGSYLHEGWMRKRRMSEHISSPEIDKMYADALVAGAVGGKLLGAGGGGFFLFFASPDRHKDIAGAVGLSAVPFKIEDKGSEIIYDSHG